jgi:hypothetical protein
MQTFLMHYAIIAAVAAGQWSSLRTLIAYAEYENPLLDVYALELAHRLAVAKRQAPPLLRLAGHNHTSPIAHINTDQLGAAIRAFIHGA